jgi:hypothetical protein
MYCGNGHNPTSDVSYKDREVGDSYTTYIYDVTSDSALDTLVISRNETVRSMHDIYLLRSGVKERIISISPWRDSTFVLAKSPIEDMHLEHTESKNGIMGLRVVIRNRAVAPDCMFIDIYHDDTQWIVESVYLLNTARFSDLDLFVKCVEVEKPLVEMFGQNLICDPVRDIELEYWGYYPEMDKLRQQ